MQFLNIAYNGKMYEPKRKGKSKNKKKGDSSGPKPAAPARVTPAVEEPFVPPSAADRTLGAPAPAQSGQAATNIDRKKKQDNLKKKLKDIA